MNTLMVVSQIGLWIVVSLLLLVVFALVRQIGLLHRRIARAGARMTADGPAIGEVAPPLDVVDMEGRNVSLGTARRKMTMLVFVSPGCSVCGSLMPAVRSVWRSERKHLEVVLIGSGASTDGHVDYARRHKTGEIPYVVSQDIADRYQVAGPPHAVLVGADGLIKARGLVNHLEHLESLLVAARVGHPTVESYFGLTHSEAGETPRSDRAAESSTPPAVQASV